MQMALYRNRERRKRRQKVGGATGASTSITAQVAPTIVSIVPNSGCEQVGTFAVITGTGFDGATSVDFDTTPADNVVFINDTTLQVITPIMPDGQVDVVVTNSVGSDTLTNGFTFDPIPEITSLDVVIGTELGGTTVVITGAHFTAGTTVTFGGLAAGVTFDSSTQLTVTTPDYSGTIGVGITELVDVVVTDTCGSDTLVNGFTYHQIPEYTSIAANPTNPCDLETGLTYTITGDYFTNTGDMQVKFGDPGVLAAHTYVSQTSLTVLGTDILSALGGLPLLLGTYDVHVLNQYGGATAVDDLTINGNPLTPTLQVLIDGATSIAINVKEIAAFQQWVGGNTFTRIFMTDGMHQDVFSSAAAISSGITGSACPHSVRSNRLLDGSPMFYVPEHITTIEHFKSFKSAEMHLNGHWVIYFGSSYSSVLANATS